MGIMRVEKRKTKKFKYRKLMVWVGRFGTLAEIFCPDREKPRPAQIPWPAYGLKIAGLKTTDSKSPGLAGI